jgi:hypothetical protein
MLKEADDPFEMFIRTGIVKRRESPSPLFKVFSDEAHMSGSEIDDGTDKATA